MSMLRQIVVKLQIPFILGQRLRNQKDVYFEGIRNLCDPRLMSAKVLKTPL